MAAGRWHRASGWDDLAIANISEIADSKSAAVNAGVAVSFKCCAFSKPKRNRHCVVQGERWPELPCGTLSNPLSAPGHGVGLHSQHFWERRPAWPFRLPSTICCPSAKAPFGRSMVAATLLAIAIGAPLSFLFAYYLLEARRYRRELTRSASHDQLTEFFNGVRLFVACGPARLLDIDGGTAARRPSAGRRGKYQIDQHALWPQLGRTGPAARRIDDPFFRAKR